MKGKIKEFDFDVSIQSGPDPFLSKPKGVTIAVDDGADLDELIRCQGAKLVKVVASRKKDSKKVQEIKNNHTNVKDSVLFTDETDVDDLQTIVADVTKHHGKAVIVSVPLKFNPRIPVFVLDDSFFQIFGEKQVFDKATVSFFPINQTKYESKLPKNHYHPLVDEPISEESKEVYELGIFLLHHGILN
mmetsp:Transcript_7963/g.12020  ORF Transcript_7963/g.12020 Transcript_7963/m.12020 type:complete len:188 (+) Transcript_7963:296-859(+)|eukprot:CAMPEP_0203668724 /NCGR_PEP_ID=MMETSP0090-20130426/5283_1 /ASSEMBLY_ACC=CAM_ASM_001088 /TAXON_ID=426623 /ORGANISM="Chaetoceros affinis, Strain CCMP159" /LENGTH=187 /DNA_ID=CAMNT_0050533235 /DNA_START=238 /DNA_END=801 /DNA_ORIENTATION=-